MKEYKCPSLAVDLIVRCKSHVGNGIVLIERKNTPRGLALPGGFVDYGESVWRAAIREAQEETGLTVKLDKMFHVYSNPMRDPRQHVVSVVFIADACGDPVAADDAKEVHIVKESRLLARKLVFDHEEILKDYMKYYQNGSMPHPYK
jgi:8-oxo-dGTP diphosphatase